MKLATKNIILLILLVGIVITPMLLKGDADFEGADGQAEEAITEIHSDYEPWFEPFWEPPSGEIESLLFCVQAAIGAGVVGYALGRIATNHKEKTSASAK